ncbi:MAG: hypothetical protein CVV21_03180 [Candidatus Goldiibacteriota bacterium HGW-Goldbacteria-1]|jgi:hypothetical protein|nr:MAG: hypothetical protein CVV21_03180 [Candidatus Goldiibacteriota bacterium HGW-Goldbacteria-1]
MKRIMIIMAIALITTAIFAASPTPVPGNVKTGKTIKMMIKVPVQIVDGAYVAQVGDDIKALTTGGTYLYNEEKTEAIVILHVPEEDKASASSLVKASKKEVKENQVKNYDKQFKGLKNSYNDGK